MRALWVTAEPPDRSLGGGHIRQAHLIERLADAVDVELLCVGDVDDPRVRAAVGAVTTVATPPPLEFGSTTRRRVEDLRRAVRSQPSEVIAHDRERALLRPLLERRGACDVILVDHAGLAPLVEHRRQDEAWCNTLQNVASVRTSQEIEHTRGRRQRWLLERDATKARRFERWVLGTYDLVFAVSEDDADDLPGPTAVVPNGVDLERFRPSPVPSEPHVVLTGTLGYLPNVDGSLWFVREVWPLVRAEVPGARLTMVGRNPVPEQLALRDSGIHVEANVPDVLPFLEGARLAIVPLRIGSGTRLKALEALAAGRPVVGTPIGLGGLRLQRGEEVFEASTAADFAAAVCRVLVDDNLAARLAAAGRAAAERYSWDEIGARFADRVVDLAAQAGQRRRAPRSSS